MEKFGRRRPARGLLGCKEFRTDYFYIAFKIAAYQKILGDIINNVH